MAIQGLTNLDLGRGGGKSADEMRHDFNFVNRPYQWLEDEAALARARMTLKKEEDYEFERKNLYDDYVEQKKAEDVANRANGNVNELAESDVTKAEQQKRKKDKIRSDRYGYQEQDTQQSSGTTMAIQKAYDPAVKAQKKQLKEAAEYAEQRQRQKYVEQKGKEAKEDPASEAKEHEALAYKNLASSAGLLTATVASPYMPATGVVDAEKKRIVDTLIRDEIGGATNSAFAVQKSNELAGQAIIAPIVGEDKAAQLTTVTLKQEPSLFVKNTYKAQGIEYDPEASSGTVDGSRIDVVKANVRKNVAKAYKTYDDKMQHGSMTGFERRVAVVSDALEQSGYKMGNNQVEDSIISKEAFDQVNIMAGHSFMEATTKAQQKIDDAKLTNMTQVAAGLNQIRNDTALYPLNLPYTYNSLVTQPRLKENKFGDITNMDKKMTEGRVQFPKGSFMQIWELSKGDPSVINPLLLNMVAKSLMTQEGIKGKYAGVQLEELHGLLASGEMFKSTNPMIKQIGDEIRGIYSNFHRGMGGEVLSKKEQEDAQKQVVNEAYDAMNVQPVKVDGKQHMVKGAPLKTDDPQHNAKETFRRRTIAQAFETNKPFRDAVIKFGAMEGDGSVRADKSDVLTIFDAFATSNKTMKELVEGESPIVKKVQVFPSKHPMVQNEDGSRSNVVIASGEHEGREYAFPTMVNGKQYSNEQAFDMALMNGIEKYPSFDTPEEATEWAKNVHAHINEDGTMDTVSSGLDGFAKNADVIMLDLETKLNDTSDEAVTKGQGESWKQANIYAIRDTLQKTPLGASAWDIIKKDPVKSQVVGIGNYASLNIVKRAMKDAVDLEDQSIETTTLSTLGNKKSALMKLVGGSSEKIRLADLPDRLSSWLSKQRKQEEQSVLDFGWAGSHYQANVAYTQLQRAEAEILKENANYVSFAGEHSPMAHQMLRDIRKSMSVLEDYAPVAVEPPDLSNIGAAL